MTQDWQAKRQQLLDGDEVHRLEFPVLESMYQQALAIARESGWSEEEAMRLIFASGLAYLRGESVVRKLERADTPERVLEEFHETTRQMMEEASHAAVLKFQAYRLAEDNQVMEMHENAMRNTLLMQQNRMAIYREDEEKLRARLRHLEAENERLKALVPNDGAKPAHEAGARRLLRRLKR